MTELSTHKKILNSHTGQLPFVTIAICSLNGAKRIGESLASLSALEYPKDRYEIIVVDDGSSDTTGEVAEAHGATVVRHPLNRGIPASRNSALKTARGELLAYFDDDCIAAPDWLGKLVEQFADPAVAAVGGRIDAYSTRYIAQRFLLAMGYGNPSPIAFGKSKNPLVRFYAYIKSMFLPLSVGTVPVQVQAVYTANAAYRTEVLREIGGFDETLLSDEDTDVSTRLRQAGKRIVFIPSAIVRHRHHEKLLLFVRQTYRRAENTLRYYHKQKKIPPIYPLPFFFLCILGVLAFATHDIKIVLEAIFCIPQVLYSWWMVRYVRGEGSVEYILYPYIQLVLESSTVLGMVRGWYRTNSASKGYLDISVFSLFTAFAAAFTILVASIQSLSPWIAAPIVLPGIILLPGLLLAFALRMRTESIYQYFLYVLGLGIAYLLFGGLAINWLLPLAHITQPLSLNPLLISYSVSICILICTAWLRNKEYEWSWHPQRPDFRTMLFGFTPILFVLLSVIGTQVLNNFGTGAFTISMLIGIGVYVTATALWSPKKFQGVHVFALYCISLSLLFMYSLRSHHIIGWDINAEYQVFQATLAHGFWSMSFYPGQAYNACLSITILPTIFQILTHVPSEYVFKVLFQILFAATPLAVYFLAQKYVHNSLAFLASFILISQTWFYEQMPALIRQEVAFIFYALLLLVLFDTQLSKKVRMIIFYICTAALVLSHYSTTYTWLTLMFFALVLLYASKLVLPWTRSYILLLKPSMLVLTLLLVVIWEVPVTHTAQGVVSFAQNSGEAKEALDPALIESTFVKSILSNGNTNTNENLLGAYNIAIENYGSPAGYETFTDAPAANYAPVVIDDKKYVASVLPAFLSSAIQTVLKINKTLFTDVLTVVGLIFLAVTFWRKNKPITYEFVLLNITSFGLIVLMTFVPYLQQYYNFTRLYLQMFILLGIACVLGGWVALKYIPAQRMLILATMAVLLFFSANGLADRVTGGQDRITLTQPNGTFDTFYVYDAEVASAHWLAANRDLDDPVQADTLANLRLQSFANLNANNLAIFPQTIETNSYIYMSIANVLRSHAFYQFDNDTLTYNYPSRFIDSHKDLIYNNGESKIYR